MVSAGTQNPDRVAVRLRDLSPGFACDKKSFGVQCFLCCAPRHVSEWSSDEILAFCGRRVGVTRFLVQSNSTLRVDIQ